MDGNMNEKPRLGFHEKDLNSQFFEDVVKGINKDASLVGWSENDFDSGINGIATALLGDQSEVQDKRILGFIAFKVKYKLADEILEKNLVLKVKTRGKATAELFRDMSLKIGGQVAEGYKLFYQDVVGFRNAEHHDIMMMTLNEPSVDAIRPKAYLCIYDDAREIFAYVMDDFRSDSYSHLDTVDDLSLWSEQDIMNVLEGIAGLHGRFYGCTDDIPKSLSQWLVNLHDISSQPESLFFWVAMQNEACTKFPNMVDAELASILKCSAENLTKITRYIYDSPQTLLHNDLTNRNICLRTTCPEGTKPLCAYDWEVCGTGCAQRDIAIFLTFTLPADTEVSTWIKYRDSYRKFLKEAVEKRVIPEAIKSPLLASLEEKQFNVVFDMCVIEALYTRVVLYCLTNQIMELSYLPAVVKNIATYVKHITPKYDFLQSSRAAE